MPCTYWEPEYTKSQVDEITKKLHKELTAKNKETRELVKQLKNVLVEKDAMVNQLSVRVDTLQELIIQYGTDGFPPEVLKEITQEQVQHRKVDLERLAQVNMRKQTPSGKPYPKGFKERVKNADPNFPLEPQLGFNPDDY